MRNPSSRSQLRWVQFWSITNKIDAPTKHLIRTYSIRWRIETFFRDSKQDLGFEDCEVERDAGASRHGTC